MVVISYARFSSPRQARGDSLRRQAALAEDWCRRHKHTLDVALKLADEGKSGWSGENTRTGALAALLKMLRAGKVKPGTILLIEALDRLTRQDLTVAVPLLLELLAAGLTIVTLQDGKEWTKSGMRDMTDFVMSVLLLARGHEESQRKSLLVRAAFDAHRQRRSNEIFGSAPGWLSRPDKRSSWKIDKAKAKAIRAVFELAAEGWGSVQIAKRANALDWPVPTRLGNKEQGWHSRMPGHILKNRAVLGEHEFRLRGREHQEQHWHGKATGIVVPDFYPRIINDDLWHRAQAAIEARRTAPKRRDDHYFNIWAGLLRCGACGASMQRKVEHRGANGSGQMICSSSMAGKTACPRASIRLTDYALLSEICRLAGPVLGSVGDRDFGAELAVAKSRLTDLDNAAERIAAALEETGDALPALLSRARELTGRRQTVMAQISAIEQAAASAPHNMLDTGFADAMMPLLYLRADEAKAARADCNTRLRRAVMAIWLWPYNVALVQYHGEPYRHVIPLPPKKNGALQPFLSEALQGRLEPAGRAIQGGRQS